MIIIIALMLPLLIVVFLLIAIKQNSDISYKELAQDILGGIKEAANSKNNIDHCPVCGSHNIKLYRKGYNYKIGFWGAIFGVKGAGYAGGFDANNTCCRCMDCGKDWETDYDYRLIDK